MTIEDIILDFDKRGVTHLRPYLPSNFCEEAAQVVLDSTGLGLIATGFWIMGPEQPETDGPPGAIAIGRALQALGRPAAYVTDKVTFPLMQGLVGGEAEVIDFPITADDESRRYASDLQARLNPGLLVSIERCSMNRDGVYLNMRGLDISSHTARLDYLFSDHPASVGIGDGGNEIGMGNLAREIPGVATLPDNPAVTRVTKLVITSVSNWGGYGLVAAMSKLAGRNLLPSVEEEAAMIRRTVELGAVDGFSTENKDYVDGFTLAENGQLLARLHRVLEDEGVPSK